jgi:Protein of unknown function (DUF3311)
VAHALVRAAPAVMPTPALTSKMVKPPRLPSLLLALIPFAAMCFSVSLWDRIYPIVLGMPFNIFWLTLWIVLTPLCMWGAYRLETPRNHDQDNPPA